MNELTGFNVLKEAEKIIKDYLNGGIDYIKKSAFHKCGGFEPPKEWFFEQLNEGQFLVVNAFHVGGKKDVQCKDVFSYEDKLSVPIWTHAYLSDYIAMIYWGKVKKNSYKQTYFSGCWEDGIKYIRQGQIEAVAS